MADELEILSDKERAIVGKIPIGDWCYGSALNDEGEVINGVRIFKTIHCPYQEGKHGCTYLNIEDEWIPEIKACNIKKYYKFFKY